MRKLLLALGLLLASTPAWAQNTQCSNRPSGDSTNACANTRFVQGAVTGILPGQIALPDGDMLVGNVSNVAAAVTMSQDCTISNAGVITCLRTNNVLFTTAATTALGTSGAVIPLLNGNNTHSGNNTFSGTNNFTSTFQINGNTMTFPAAAATLTRTIASGAKALATGAISSATCTSAQTDTATGTLTTDTVTVAFNADPTGVTGYVPLTTGMLSIIYYPTTDTINFKVCNNTSSSITPGAITINWRVIR